MYGIFFMNKIRIQGITQGNTPNFNVSTFQYGDALLQRNIIKGYPRRRPEELAATQSSMEACAVFGSCVGLKNYQDI